MHIKESIPSDERSMKAAIANPCGNSLIYSLVTAIQQLGITSIFYTGFYYKPEKLSPVLNTLPRGIQQQVLRELSRRFHPALDVHGVLNCHSTLDLLSVICNRIGLTKRFADGLRSVHYEFFDRSVAHHLKSQTFDIAIGFDDSFLHTLRRAKQNHAITVLNQLTGHSTVWRRIMSEEAELCPEFADSLPNYYSNHLDERYRCEVMEADYILACSDYVKDSLLQAGVVSERIALLPFGVNTEHFQPPKKRNMNKFRILFLGQITQRKGVAYLLEAFRRLKLKDAELVLVGNIVGSGDGLKPYQSIFQHIPNAPHNAIKNIYAGASIFVLPSIHEGSALVIYEALASGLPVITTPNAGSIVRDGEEGFIVPIRDVETLMDRILRLYENKELRHTMSSKARVRALDYTWNHYRDRLSTLLCNFLFERGKVNTYSFFQKNSIRLR
jgi:glycosyltransferase involved in cell wall biosynthesis